MDLLREKQRVRGIHPGVAAAMIGSAVVGGAISSSASKSAANTEAGAANSATQAQKDMFNTTVGLESPFRSAGVGANQRLSTLLGIPSNSQSQQTQDNFDGAAYLAANPDVAADPYFAANPYQHYQQYGAQENRPFTWAQGTGPNAASNTTSADFGSLLKPFGMSDFQLDPGIQFQLKYGQQALQNSQAAQNGTLSGGALKDLITFNQGLAGTGYQSAFDRYNANRSFTLGSLLDLSNQGQAAAGNTVSAAPGFSSGIAGTIQGAGNASAAGTVGSANAMSGGLSGASTSYLLSSLLNKGGVSGADLGAANSSSDPIGTLNARMGWTA